MRDIHYLGFGIYAKDDTLHRADEMIGSAVVGGQRNDGSRQNCLPDDLCRKLAETIRL
jgi:hypothetical protein